MSTVSKVVYYITAVLGIASALVALFFCVTGDGGRATYYIAHACFCMLLSLWVWTDSKVEL